MRSKEGQSDSVLGVEGRRLSDGTEWRVYVHNSMAEMRFEKTLKTRMWVLNVTERNSGRRGAEPLHPGIDV